MDKSSFNKSNFIILCLILAIVLLGVALLVSIRNKNADNPTISTEHHNEDLPQVDFKTVKDEHIQKLFEVLSNAKDYEGKEITIEGQIFMFNTNYTVGKSHPDDERYVINISIEAENDKQIEGFSEKDWVKVTGKVKLEDQAHGDHTHTVPIIKLDSIEKIEPHTK